MGSGHMHRCQVASEGSHTRSGGQAKDLPGNDFQWLEAGASLTLGYCKTVNLCTICLPIIIPCDGMSQPLMVLHTGIPEVIIDWRCAVNIENEARLLLALLAEQSSVNKLYCCDCALYY